MIHVIHYISKYPGMIHSGIGGTQLSNFLSVLNIHSIDFKALKERENETGAAIEAQAEISEERYLQEEINQSFTGLTFKLARYKLLLNWTSVLNCYLF